MIFCVLVVAIIVTVAIVVLIERGQWYSDPTAAGCVALVASSLISTAVMLLLIFTMPLEEHVTVESKRDLVSIGSDSNLTGQAYFLGGGYLKEERVLHYAAGDGGEFTLETVRADSSTIRQQAGKPTVTLMYHTARNPWLAPFPLNGYRTAEFHVPEGSILSDYSITN